MLFIELNELQNIGRLCSEMPIMIRRLVGIPVG